jgi:acyl-CoA reductase-like NAD-dependent aldehyde dehydrogenase
MNTGMQLRRSLLSLALFALVAAAAQARDETTIAVKTRAGTIERVDAGDITTLEPGEVRALSTRSGSAATITRSDDGIVLAIAGEQYPIALPDVEAAAAAGKRVVYKHDEAGAHAAHDESHALHKVVVVKHKDGNGRTEHGDELVAGMGLPDLDDDAALLAAGDGPKVFVRRTKVLEEGAVR